jgi:hypothetical protein
VPAVDIIYAKRGIAETTDAEFCATIKYETVLDADKPPSVLDANEKSHIPLVLDPLVNVPGAENQDPVFFLTYNRGTLAPDIGIPTASAIATPFTTTLPFAHDAVIGEYVIVVCA